MSVQATSSYQDLRQKVISGNETDIPFYLRLLFEKGPDHYLMENPNCSRSSLEEGVCQRSEIEKARLVVLYLQSLSQHVMESIAECSTYTVTIVPDIRDYNTYLVDYASMLSDLFDPWIRSVGLHLEFSESQGLGAKNVTITVFRPSQPSLI